MEIERKWMVNGWPEGLTPYKTEMMSQGYLHADVPTVRIRREEEVGGHTEYILCIKSKGRLSREEIEIKISVEQYESLKTIIGYPLIEKERRTYHLKDGMNLEVNHVDEGLKSEFWYAEVEYESEEQARNWNPEDVNLGAYLHDDVTEKPGQSMAAYWSFTRLKNTD